MFCDMKALSLKRISACFDLFICFYIHLRSVSSVFLWDHFSNDSSNLHLSVCFSCFISFASPISLLFLCCHSHRNFHHPLFYPLYISVLPIFLPTLGVLAPLKKKMRNERKRRSCRAGERATEKPSWGIWRAFLPSPGRWARPQKVTDKVWGI